MGAVRIFQIYYDAATRALLDPGFVPLDNTSNPRPDWFELWPIRSFLHHEALNEDDWYGFLSPHFQGKTGLGSAEVRRFLTLVQARSDVALILHAWDQVAYFMNPFEQGEIWHPGIATLSQTVCDELGFGVDLSQLVSHSGNFTFSNYIVAKPAYWRLWLSLADRFVAVAEDPSSGLAAQLRQSTSYGSAANQAPIKAFIQERLPALVLAKTGLRTSSLNTSDTFPVWDQLFEIDVGTRGALQTCDLLKRRYTETGDARYVALFKEVRQLVRPRFRLPSPFAGPTAETALP